MRAHIDKPLLVLIAFLIASGALMFVSAAFGLLARGASHVSTVVFNHLVLGVSLGLGALFVTSMLSYRRWRVWAPYLYGLALCATALVFIPGLGLEHGGGTRWLDLGFTTFQTSELLKIATVLIGAWYFSTFREHIASWRGLVGFSAILALPVVLLVFQPDIGTLGVICASVLAIFIAAGARAKDIALVIFVGFMLLAALSLMRPYMLERVATFINPAENPQTEGYQIRQSLIAIGSGGLFGRGFGQGVQKFTYLPEPMGDSIFAVAAEEVGFVGGSAIIALFLLLALRGFMVATHAPDLFGALAAVGISTYFVSEAFINIASMLGLAPLTGIPLTFMSQGGSAMLVSLASAGILLSISRRSPTKT